MILGVTLAAAPIFAAGCGEAFAVGEAAGGAGGGATAGSNASTTSAGGDGASGTSTAVSGTTSSSDATTTASSAAATTGAGGAGGEGSGASTSSAGGGGLVGSGDCSSSADCGGAPCVALVEGGFHVCQEAVDPAVECTGSGLDECCDSTDCEGGLACHLAPVAPACFGLRPVPHNICASAECVGTVDCRGPAICAPPGTVHNQVAVCIPAFCKHDADCQAEAGGVCATVESPCCAALSLACVYPSDGCRSNGDCDGHCSVSVDGRASCHPGPPLCPG
jgi:hypothetical protein